MKSLFLLCCLFFTPVYANNSIQGSKSCLTLDFKDLPVVDAFRIYFDAVKDNFVLDKNLSGSIELRLTCVDAPNVLVALAQVSGVQVRNLNGIVYVTPNNSSLPPASASSLLDFAQNQPKQDSLKQNDSKQNENAQYLNEVKKDEIAKLIKIYNSNVGDIVALINRNYEDVIIRPFESDNSVYLVGNADKIALIEQSISLIDKPKKQFVIKAKLIATSDNFLENIGTSFNAEVNDGDIKAGASTIFTSSVAAATGGSSLIFQKAGNIILNAKISAAISSGDAYLISEPHTIAYENRQSSINQGLRIPYQTQLPMGGFQVSFVDAALTLRVTPRLGDDKTRIILDIYFSKNSAGSPSPAGVSIETREINTTVALQSGETLALGGIDESSNDSSDSGIPFLRDIPYLGYAFGSTSETKKHNKIVLMITPTMI